MDINFENLLLLNMVPGLLPSHQYKLLKYFGTADKILKSSIQELRQVANISEELSAKIFATKETIDIKKELDLIEKHNVSIITIFDDTYPKILKSMPDPPLILYVKGKLLREDDNSIAIVGCRKASSYGKIIAEKFAGDLAVKGFTIVSGMARGIDTYAHRGCLAKNGRTIAVLGNGLVHCYPPESKNLMSEISENGAVISEFSMQTKPERFNFPRRNRIISGISLGIIVVEAPKSSGALITADFALEQGKEVFAIPGNINSENSIGPNNLIKNGAKLVENIEDIIEELRPILPLPLKEDKQTNSYLPILSQDEQKLYQNINSDPVHIDVLVRNCGFEISKTNYLLLNLEIKKIIQQIPGKLFIRT